MTNDILYTVGMQAGRREFLHARRQVDRKLGRKWQVGRQDGSKETRRKGTLYKILIENKLDAALPNRETPQYRL